MSRDVQFLVILLREFWSKFFKSYLSCVGFRYLMSIIYQAHWRRGGTWRKTSLTIFWDHSTLWYHYPHFYVLFTHVYLLCSYTKKTWTPMLRPFPTSISDLSQAYLHSTSSQKQSPMPAILSNCFLLWSVRIIYLWLFLYYVKFKLNLCHEFIYAFYFVYVFYVCTKLEKLTTFSYILYHTYLFEQTI